MSRTVRILAEAGGVIAIGTAAVLAGRASWNRRTLRTVERLGAGASLPAGGTAGAFSLAQLEGLPAPVVRYFGFALQPGQRLVHRARVEHRGTFATRPGLWEPFTSTQQFRVRPPAFVWDARIRMGGLPAALGVRVRDSYLDREGAMYGAVAALVPVADQRGTPEMAAGALARYLAETVWFPTALLPGTAGAGVTWTPIDDSTARATLTDGPVSVTVDFHFGDRGEIVRVSGERYRDVDGTAVMTPWEGHLGEYVRRDGMMVPDVGEVAWLPRDGRRAYWRGRIGAITYDWR